MNALPHLSIGLPVYNGAEYLAESIAALLGQSYQDFELIISDNASTDSTADICNDYLKQDSRIRYFRQPRNIGLAPNHNFVLAKARGELFKLASHDDLYDRELLRVCMAALHEHPDVVLAHSWTAAIDEAGNITQALKYPLATDSPLAPERFRSILMGSSGLFEEDSGDGRRLVSMDNVGIIRADDQYGVIRTAVMRRIAPLGSYHRADRVVVPELSLYGRFHQTPAWLYFRRDHPNRPDHAAPSIRARCAVLDPCRADRLRHPTSRLVAEYFWGYVSAIQRAPLSAAERRECHRYLLNWMAGRALHKMRQHSAGEIHHGSFSAIDDEAAGLIPAIAGRGARSL